MEIQPEISYYLSHFGDRKISHFMAANQKKKSKNASTKTLNTLLYNEIINYHKK
jgi:hypothetical protein